MLDAPTFPAPLPPSASPAWLAAAGKTAAAPFAGALEQCLAPSSPDATQAASATPPPEAALPVPPTEVLPTEVLPTDALPARPAPGGSEPRAAANPVEAAPEAAKSPDAAPPHPDEETERADDLPAPAALVLLAVPAPPPTLPPASAKSPEAHGMPHSGEAVTPAAARKTPPGLTPAEPDAGKPPNAPSDAPGQAAAQAAPLEQHKAVPHVALEGPSPIASQPPPAPALQPSAPSPPAAAPLPSPPTTATLPMPQVAPMVASIAATVREGQPHTLVIRLDPAELGRVEVQIERDAGGPTRISLSAERPDTLHAMQRDQAHLHRALDLAGVPPDGRQVQYQLAPADPPPLPAGSFGGSGGTGGQGPGGGGPGARDRHGRYVWAGEEPSPNPPRRRLAGVDITA